MSYHISVQFYNCSEMGLYPIKRGESDNESPLVMNSIETWKEFTKWVNDEKLFTETATYGKNTYKHIYRTFCLSFRKLKEVEGYLLITWNEAINNNGALYSINANSPASNPEVREDVVDPSQILGYPSYFWIIPEKEIVASIKPQNANSLVGTANLQAYIKEFIRSFSKYAVELETDDSESERRYTYEINGEPTRLFPRFSLRVRKSVNQSVDLLENYHSVRRIVHKKSIEHEGESLSQLELLMYKARKAMGLGRVPSDDEVQQSKLYESTDWKLEMNYNPESEEELDQLIQSWNKRYEKDPELAEELGFKLKGNNDVVWLSESYSKVKNIPASPQYMTEKNYVISSDYLEKFIKSNISEFRSELK